MFHPTRFSRRLLCAGSLAGLVLPVSVRAARPSDTWDDAEIPETDIRLEWDPAVWKHDETLSASGFVLKTDLVYDNDTYFLSVKEHTTAWSSLDDAEASAMNEWFSQGLNGSVIVGEYASDTAYGWIHFADFMGNPRTVSLMQYLRPDDEGPWISLSLSMDRGAYEALKIEDVVDAVAFDDGSILVIDQPEDIMRAIGDAFTA